MPSILPPNATPLEGALEGATAVDVRLGSVVEAIKTAKLVDLPEDWLPWLAWEYGLAEILPYVPDPRTAIQVGLRFQRMRGTPAGLRLALSWVGEHDPIIEETPPGPQFATYQVDPGYVPSRQQVRDIVAVAALAAPARSRLVRLYHGCDIRPLRLSGVHPLQAAVLSDWSGTWLDGVWQSFCRRHGIGVTMPPTTTVLGRYAARGLVAAYLDRFRLNFSALNSEVVPNWAIAGASVSVHVAGPLPSHTPSMDVAYHVPRASVCLSEHGPLGDPNTVFPWRRVLETGEPIVLSERGDLSDYSLTATWVPVDELTLADIGMVGGPLPTPFGMHGRTHRRGILVMARHTGALVLDHQNGAVSGVAAAAPPVMSRIEATSLDGDPYDPPWAWALWDGPTHGTATGSLAGTSLTKSTEAAGLDGDAYKPRWAWARWTGPKHGTATGSLTGKSLT